MRPASTFSTIQLSNSRVEKVKEKKNKKNFKKHLQF